MNQKEIKITPLKAKNITYIVVFSVVILLYAIMLKQDLVDRTLGLVLMGFFAVLTLYFLITIIFPRPSIIINPEGIKDNIIRGKGLIEWSRISEVYICIIPKKKYDLYYLGLNYRKDENDKRKIKFKGKVSEKKGDVVISLDELDMQPYDIYNTIQKYYSKFVKKA